MWKQTQSFFLKNFFNVLGRERERAGEGQRERGKERISGRLHAVSRELDAGLELTNHKIMT